MGNASDFVWDFFTKIGLRHVFLLPGGGCMYLVDSLARNPKISSIPMLHEQSVGIAAEAYAQFDNEVSVALVTTGPGVTNAITACAAAWTDSTPVIFISGQVKTSDSSEGTHLRQRGFQEVSTVNIVKNITKYAVRPTSFEELVASLHKAYNFALEGRPGPVWLDIPLDIQNFSLDKIQVQRLEIARTEDNSHQINSDLRLMELIKDWKKAERPLILAGNGIRLAGMTNYFEKLIRKTNTATLLTWKALDLLSDEDTLNAGRPGAIAQRWSNLAQQNADFMLILGARLDTGQIAYRPDSFAREAIKYYVDVDINELNKFKDYKFNLIHSDLALFIPQLFETVIDFKPTIKQLQWNNQIHTWKNRYPLIDPYAHSFRDGISSYIFIEELSKQMSEKDIFVPGSSGACSEISMQAFKVKKGQRVLNSEALGPMGFGIPAPIGAYFASGCRRTICIDGDGGFMMNIQELATVHLHKLNIKYFVQNNNGYGSIKATQDNYFSGRRLGTDKSSGLEIPPIKNLAKAFDIPYFKIASNAEISDTISEILKKDGPIICELVISEKQKTLFRTTNFIDKNGQISTYTMEDITPVLSLDELRNNMYVPLLPETVDRIR